MKLGDQVLFYHSVTNPGVVGLATVVKNPGVVGLATVVKEAYPDPTAMSGAQPKDPWVVVELEPIMMFEKAVSLAHIKAEPLLANISLIRQSRLSVMPIRPDEFELLLKMGANHD